MLLVIDPDMKDERSSKSMHEAILDATDRLLARQGYKKMTVDDLAREAGIGKGTVYLHFSSKEEIALSHIDRIIDRLKQNLAAIARKSSAVEERLREMVIERVMYRFDGVQHYSQSLNEMLTILRPKLLERRKRHFIEEAQIFAGVIAEGQALSVLVKGNPIDIAETLVTATNSLLPYSLSAFELGERTDLANRAEKTADLLIRGLKG